MGKLTHTHTHTNRHPHTPHTYTHKHTQHTHTHHTQTTHTHHTHTHTNHTHKQTTHSNNTHTHTHKTTVSISRRNKFSTTHLCETQISQLTFYQTRRSFSLYVQQTLTAEGSYTHAGSCRVTGVETLLIGVKWVSVHLQLKLALSETSCGSFALRHSNFERCHWATRSCCRRDWIEQCIVYFNSRVFDRAVFTSLPLPEVKSRALIYSHSSTFV